MKYTSLLAFAFSVTVLGLGGCSKSVAPARSPATKEEVAAPIERVRKTKLAKKGAAEDQEAPAPDRLTEAAKENLAEPDAAAMTDASAPTELEVVGPAPEIDAVQFGVIGAIDSAKSPKGNPQITTTLDGRPFGLIGILASIDTRISTQVDGTGLDLLALPAS